MSDASIGAAPDAASNLARALPPRWLSNALGTVAGTAFLVAVGAHALSFSRDPHISLPPLWPMWPAVLVPFAVMILVDVIGWRLLPPDPSLGFFERIRANNELNRRRQRATIRGVPGWALAFGVVLFVYAIVNFILVADAMRGGTPAVERGHYYVDNHGTEMRPLSEPEYRKLRAYEVRGTTGHWMLFSFIAFTYFAFMEPRVRAASSSADRSDGNPGEADSDRVSQTSRMPGR